MTFLNTPLVVLYPSNNFNWRTYM